MIRRVALALALVLAVLGLSTLDDPHGAAPATPSPVVGASVADTPAATWFCAAGGGDLGHQVIITAFDDEVRARLTGYTADTGGAVTSEQTVAARSQLVVSIADLGPNLGGVTVEIAGGPATVAHRLIGSGQADEANCSTSASDRWYFASANTELVKPNEGQEAVARLWLFNPFPTDASVDIRATYDDSVRVPPKLRGIIVPAGTSRMVELNAEIQRRPQIAFSVEARGGRIVAELVQTVPGRGLRLAPGAPAAATSWYLADGFAGSNASEIVHVYNPGADDVTATLTVYPTGLDPASFPEPFVLDIPGRRAVSLDLAAETRLPPEGLRSMRVDVVDGDGVVVTQADSLVGGGGDGTAATRPAVAGGLASSGGVTAQATRWFVTAVGPGADGQPVVVVANPSPDAIAVVDLVSVAGGERTTIAGAVEISPLQSLVIDVTEATTAGAVGIEVSSESPVVVSSRMTANAQVDLWTLPAVPESTSASSFPGLG